MKALLEAVKDRLAATGALSELASGGVFAGRAGDGAALPYLVWAAVSSGRVERNTGGTTIERRTVRFDLYTLSASDAAEVVEVIEGAFFASALTLDEGDVIVVRKARDGLALQPTATGEGEEVWRGRVEMEFVVERPAGD
jgi:hypothetical protein